jgi:hypothetical protein
MTLHELRRARKLTQVRMAIALWIGQGGISKLESGATYCFQHCGERSMPWAAESMLTRTHSRRKQLTLSNATP